MNIFCCKSWVVRGGRYGKAGSRWRRWRLYKEVLGQKFQVTQMHNQKQSVCMCVSLCVCVCVSRFQKLMLLLVSIFFKPFSKKKKKKVNQTPWTASSTEKVKKFLYEVVTHWEDNRWAVLKTACTSFSEDYQRLYNYIYIYRVYIYIGIYTWYIYIVIIYWYVNIKYIFINNW